jgi:hypothetical protein
MLELRADRGPGQCRPDGGGFPARPFRPAQAPGDGGVPNEPPGTWPRRASNASEETVSFTATLRGAPARDR